MQGRMKVSDLMINRKVPRLARENWPLLISQGDVAWVPGLHVAHPFRVTADTHNTLRLAVKKPRDFPP
jgi:tRNA(Ile)-lysidine synthase